jgi:OmcA/MtrC family decaheme c-type cytochrome
MGKRGRSIALAAALLTIGVGAAGIAACGGNDGASGADGTNGEAGAPGAPGAAGKPGTGSTTDGGVAEGGTRGTYDPALALQINIDKAAIASQVLTVEFSLTDKAGVPVVVPITSDGRIGTLAAAPDGGVVFTADQVAVTFVAAWLDQTGTTPGYYTPYTMAAVANGSADAGTAFKAATDDRTPTGPGKFAYGTKDGVYTYTFSTKIAVAAGNETKTHTVGAMAMRTVPATASSPSPQYYPANAEFDWLPAGGAVTVQREAVLRENCNACHGEMGHHGRVDNARQDIKLCLLCHNPSTINVDTGNSINLGDMLHKVHSGAQLPSVAETDGGVPVYPYKIGSDDYSGVTFPTDRGNCAKCHAGAKSAAVWQNPTLSACTSCHDRTYFTAAAPTTPASTKWTMHKLGQPIDPNKPGVCATCHNAGGLIDPANYHYAKPTTVALAINTAKFNASHQLEVVFDVAVTNNATKVTTHGDAALPLLMGKGSISVVLGGPTADFKYGHNKNNSFLMYKGASATGTLAGTLSAADPVTGLFTYTSTEADFDVVTGLTGTWGVGLQGAAQDVTTGAPRFVAQNPLYYFNAATGTKGTAPTPIVEAARCNTCHDSIPGHGGTRNQPAMCQLCHQPSQADESTPGNLTSPGTALGQPVDFKAFIHDIHLGADRSPNTQSFYGSSNVSSFVHFPDKLNNCQHCHLPGTNLLPMKVPTTQPTQSITINCNASPCTGGNVTLGAPVYMGPTAAVCTTCHDTSSALAHTQLMTVNPGASAPQSPVFPSGYAESCDTCHGVGRPFDVQLVHTVTY